MAVGQVSQLQKKPKCIILFECSGIVREAFAKEGWNAISCDLKPTEKPGNHIVCDFRKMLSRKAELIIAHPPCTYLSKVGISWLYKHPERYRKAIEASARFGLIMSHSCKFIAIENPIPHRHAWLPPYNELVQPWQFGDHKSKATCWWLKGLPPLLPTELGRKDTTWYYKRNNEPRKVSRSRFHPGMARAMARQWGGFVKSQLKAEV